MRIIPALSAGSAITLAAGLSAFAGTLPLPLCTLLLISGLCLCGRACYLLARGDL